MSHSLKPFGYKSTPVQPVHVKLVTAHSHPETEFIECRYASLEPQYNDHFGVECVQYS